MRSFARIGVGAGLLAFVLLACGENRVAGGSSEHENVLTARILDTAGLPVAGARAWLRPADLVADSPTDPDWSVVADSSGLIRLTTPSSAYRLEIQGAGLGALVDGVEAGPSEIRLAPRVALDACDSRWAGQRVRSVGTRHATDADTSGCIHIDSLPQGDYTFVAGGAVRELVVGAGWDLRWTGVAPLARPVWIPIPFSAIGLSTSDPLNRYSAYDASGNRLPSEHETEPRAASQGVLWVRLPSLDTTEVLRVVRDDPVLGERAFARAEGWRSVVHFGEADTSVWSGTAVTGGAGILGRGILFQDSTRSRLVLPWLGTKDSGAISVWMRVENQVPGGDSVVLELGGARLLFTTAGYVLRFQGNSAVADFPATGVPVNAGWHHLGLVWSSDSVRFWVDGVRRSQGTRPIWSGTWLDSLRFGGFTGALDEWRWSDPRRIDSASLARDLVLQERNAFRFTATPR